VTARVLVTGVDAAGRSCVIQQSPVTLQDAGTDGLSYALLYAASSASIADSGGRQADWFDLGLAAGAIRWTIVEYAPGMSFSMHHTDSVDLDTVMSGSVELTLDDGAHQLAEGDCVVMTGVDHAWHAGPDGCRLGVLAIGVTPPR
jgi:quercetin dioxygenase-like cupin family protein